MFLFLNLQLFWMKIKEKYFLFNWLYLNQSLAACQIRSKLRCQLKVDGQLSVGISPLSEFEPERIFEHTRNITFKKRGKNNRNKKYNKLAYSNLKMY